MTSSKVSSKQVMLCSPRGAKGHKAVKAAFWVLTGGCRRFCKLPCLMVCRWLSVRRYW